MKLPKIKILLFADQPAPAITLPQTTKDRLASAMRWKFEGYVLDKESGEKKRRNGEVQGKDRDEVRQKLHGMGVICDSLDAVVDEIGQPLYLWQALPDDKGDWHVLWLEHELPPKKGKRA
jgi:hypothetical protein